MKLLLRLVGVVLILLGHGRGQAYVDVTAIAGLSPVPGGATLGRGACSADFDLDGDQDLLIPAGSGQLIRYFRNDGGMSFTDVTATASPGIAMAAKGCVAADIDNDGDPDVLLAQYGHPDLLFINDGTGHFTEEAAIRGLGTGQWGWSPLFADIDRDGWLDVVVGTYRDTLGNTVPNRIYRNDGDGTFTEVTGSMGLEDSGGFFLAGVWCDFDDDGWPDLAFANDKGTHPSFAAGTIHRNQRDGTFAALPSVLGATFPADGMGADVVDLFNDGGWEFYVTDVPPTHILLSLDPATGHFTDIATTLGVAGGPGKMGWGVTFLDADNDGWQDIHVVHLSSANYLYRNPGTTGAPWTEIGGGTGCGSVDAKYSAVIADFDDDGSLDILDLPIFSGVRLLRQTAAVGNWLKIETEGTVSNRDGLGARIELTTAGVTQRQLVRTARGYLTGCDRRCHFGLGAATQADRIRIVWPSGVEQILENVPANQVFHVREPKMGLSASPIAGTNVAVELTIEGDAGLPYLVGMALGTAPGIPVAGGREIPLTLDPLLLLVLAPNPVLWPTSGLLTGTPPTGSIPLAIPAGIQGLSVSFAGLTAHPLYPSGIKTITAPLTITVQ